MMSIEIKTLIQIIVKKRMFESNYTFRNSIRQSLVKNAVMNLHKADHMSVF